MSLKLIYKSFISNQDTLCQLTQIDNVKFIYPFSLISYSTYKFICLLIFSFRSVSGYCMGQEIDFQFGIKRVTVLMVRHAWYIPDLPNCFLIRITKVGYKIQHSRNAADAASFLPNNHLGKSLPKYWFSC